MQNNINTTKLVSLLNSEQELKNELTNSVRNKDTKNNSKCNNNTKIFSNNFKENITVQKYKIESIETPFNSLSSVQKYVFGAAKRHDNFADLWNDLGFKNFPTKTNFKKDKKSIKIYGTGYAFGSDTGSVIDYLEKYENCTFDSAYEKIASVYNLEYELVNISYSKTSKPQNKTNTKKPINKGIQIDKVENKAYFESICKEFNLPLENPYFSILDNGFDISYTDLDKKPIYYTEKDVFTRQRLFKTTSKGAKYLSKKDSGYFPYLTPLAYNKEVLANNTLYSTEGEKKALFAVETLNLACIGIGGIHLGTKTERNVFDKPIYKTSEFCIETQNLINTYSFSSYQIIFDSDTFQNEGKKERALSFFSAIKKEFIAAEKLGIKEFVFTVINPSAKGKGLDDLGLYYSVKEIKDNLQDTTHHNKLFYHFRLSITEESKTALKSLKSAFLASVQTKKESLKIEINGFIGNQLLENVNSDFVTSLLTKKFTGLSAPTGLGKSYFIEKYFVHFITKVLGYKVIFCSPRNGLSKQQAKDGILFTESTNTKAIERLKTEIDNTNIVYSNYDNLRTAYKVLTEFHKKEVFIVCDEYHLIPKDCSFRKEVIKTVMDTLESCKRNLFLSATPSEIPLSENLNLFEVVSLDKKAYKAPTLIFASKNKKLECTLDCILKSVSFDKRVLVHYNNISDCKALQKELESKNIKTRICASNELETQDLAYFENIQNSQNWIWNDNVKVILCTSVLEVGINLRTDRNTDLIFANNEIYGFDLSSYLQFIARIRNYTDFEITNTIISQNSRNFLPNSDLKIDFDFTECTQFAAENAKLHTNQYIRIKNKYEKVEIDRFINKVSQNVVFDTDKEVFAIDTLSILQDYTRHEIAKGSPYFAAPKKVIFYEKEKENKSLKDKVNDIKLEREIAEKAVLSLYENDFYTLLASVFKHTKDTKLQSKCNLRSNPNEPLQLNPFELSESEKLLKNHFLLSKTVKKSVSNDLECTEIKGVLIDKQTQTIRKTKDLSRRKKAYITYFLLTNSDSQNRVRESIQIKELQRIVSILENLQNREPPLSELLKLANKNRVGKNRYTKNTLLELVGILFEFESKREIVNDKKITLYLIRNGKDFKTEMERLRE